MKQLIEAPICLSLFSFSHSSPPHSHPHLHHRNKLGDTSTRQDHRDMFLQCVLDLSLFMVNFQYNTKEIIFVFNTGRFFFSCLTSSIRREDELYLRNRDMGMRLEHSIFFFLSSATKTFCFNVFSRCVLLEMV